MAEPLPVQAVRAADHIRADRRRQKMRAGYTIVDGTPDPAERASLRTMLRRCQSLLDAITESP